MLPPRKGPELFLSPLFVRSQGFSFQICVYPLKSAAEFKLNRLSIKHSAANRAASFARRNLSPSPGGMFPVPPASSVPSARPFARGLARVFAPPFAGANCDAHHHQGQILQTESGRGP